MEDIDLLGFVGRPPFSPDDLIDISVDERGRVSVMLDQSFSRPPQLTALEALALGGAARETAPADPAVVSALRKLTDKLPAKARDLYAALARRVAAATPPPRGTDELLASLRRAADQRREVALEYDKGAAGKPDRAPSIHARWRSTADAGTSTRTIRPARQTGPSGWTAFAACARPEPRSPTAARSIRLCSSAPPSSSPPARRGR